MDTDMSSSSDTAKAALRYSSGYIRHPITHENPSPQSESENEDSIPKESLTAPQKRRMRMGLLTTKEFSPFTICLLTSKSARPKSNLLTPKSVEPTFLLTPKSVETMNRLLLVFQYLIIEIWDTRAAPSTGLPFAGNILAFPQAS